MTSQVSSQQDHVPGEFACDIVDGPEDCGVRLVCSGELDLATAPMLNGAVRDAMARGGVIVIDLRGVLFCDSSGLSVIVRAHQRARTAGRRLVVVQGPPQLRRLLEITGTDTMLEIVTEPR